MRDRPGLPGALIVARDRVCWRAGLLISMAIAGCATRLYPGPKRPAAEVASLEAGRGVEIVAVDELTLQPSTGGYQILAGVHAVTVRRHAEYFTVCFVARGGHAYLLRPAYGGGSWRPEIIDENTANVIGLKQTSPVAPDCTPEPRPMRPPAAGGPDAVPPASPPDGGAS